MKKILLFLLSLLIGIGLLVWIAQVVGWQEIKNAFLVFTGWQGLVILFLTVLVALIGTWEWKIILKSRGVDIPFKNLFKLYLAGFSIKYLAPMLIFGKEIFCSYALKEKYSIPWSKGMASVIIDRILDFTIEMVFIFLGIISFFLVFDLSFKILGIIFTIFLVLAIGICLFYFKVFKKESIIKFFIKIFIPTYQNDNTPLYFENEIFDFFKTKKKYMWGGIFLTFFEKIIKLLKTWLLITFLGKTVGLLPVFSILGFSYLAAMIPIPAVLGVHEGLQSFSFNTFGLGQGTGIVFAMIIRGAELIIALIGIFILFQLSLRALMNALLERTK